MLKNLSLLIFIGFQINLNAQSTRVVDVYVKEDTANYLIVNFDELFLERWDTLAQANFWRKVMNYGPDSCIVNVANIVFIIYLLSFHFLDST